MPQKIKLNDLQLRTLALLQQLASDDEISTDHATGGRTVHMVPQPNGDHMSFGQLTVTSRFASGLVNENVWNARQRKGIIDGVFPHQVTILPVGLSFDTGL